MMRRRSFLRGCVALLAAAPEAGGAAESSRLAVALGPDVDGIVFRGAWRAAVRRDAASGIAIEAPAAALARVRVTFADSTVTLHNDGVAAPSAFANVRSLRGVSTSGRVNLTIDDAAGGPLFLDLAGGGTARARGAVPLLRVTTSGTVRADLTGLTARIGPRTRAAGEPARAAGRGPREDRRARYRPGDVRDAARAHRSPRSAHRDDPRTLRADHAWPWPSLIPAGFGRPRAASAASE